MRRLLIATMIAGLAALGAGCGDDDVPTTPDAFMPTPVDAGPDAWTECPDPQPAPEMCEFWLGCGCDVAAGEKCTATSASRACLIAGTKVAGEICVDDTECAAGTICVPYGGELRCMQFCDGGHPCPADQACYIRITDNSPTPMTLGQVCGPVCSLLGQDCAIAGQACYPAPSYVPEMEKGICVTSGVEVQGSGCESSNECAEGFACVDITGSPSICAELCDRTAMDPGCELGTNCDPLTGHTVTGACK